MTEPGVLLHALDGPERSEVAECLRAGALAFHAFRPLVGPFDRVVVELTGPNEAIEAARVGLPAGAAQAEAVAVRLRRAGVRLDWGEPRLVDRDQLEQIAFERGQSSIEMLRADDTLVTEMQVGSWFSARWRARLGRRVAQRLPRRRRLLDTLLRPRALAVAAAADAAFWAGVRTRAAAQEWERLTRASYVLLVYHRLAGERKPGQERIDLDPRRFTAQLRLLRLLRFHQLSPDAIVGFHSGARMGLPARSFALTFDDAFLDCVRPLRGIADARPQLFVPTREVGGAAHWAGGEPVMDWDGIGEIAGRGVAVGSHARHHKPLIGLSGAELEEEIAGSLADLRERLPDALPVLAYPNGRHDGRVRAAALAASYVAGYTTEKGRNGIGTDRYCIRRISVHADDRPLAVLWKVVTGEPPPQARRGARSTARVSG